MQKTSVHNSVMRRVYAVWFVRKIASPVVLKSAIALSVLWQLKEYVSLRNVIANAPSLAHPLETLQFFGSAFVSTQVVVQVLAAASVALALLLMRDTLRGYAAFERMQTSF